MGFDSRYGDGWRMVVDADQNVSLSKRAKIILGIGAIDILIFLISQN